MNTTPHSLFSEFPSVSKDDWKQQVIKDLKGADFDQVLHWKTDENLIIEPLYDQADTKKLAYLQNYLTGKSEAEAAGMPPRNWRNCQHIRILKGAEKNANQRALLALQHDANEIIFAPENVQNLDLKVLMENIQLEFCAVSWEVSDQNDSSLADKYVAFLNSRNMDLTKIKGFLKSNTTKNALELIQKTATLPQFRAVTLCAENAEKISDELAQLAKNLVELLETDLEADLVLNNLVFSTLARSNYFEEIAKLRALRFLMTEIAQKYSKNYLAENIHILASTSVRASLEDPYQNMLSNTTQAMAGIIGGCNSLWVLPHNQQVEEVSAFSERIARNISNLLREESYFGAVIDPAAGSYYLENLTDKFMETAWEKFRKNVLKY